MKLLFVNAYKTKNPFFWLVALWTGGKYSHCEFIFNDGIAFGAKFVGGRCIFGKIKPSAANEVYNININPYQENLIRCECQKFEGTRYDYMGLLGFVFKHKIFNHDGKYFCSEIMTHILQHTTTFKSTKSPSKMSPNRLYRDLVDWMNDEFKISQND